MNVFRKLHNLAIFGSSNLVTWKFNYHADFLFYAIAALLSNGKQANTRRVAFQKYHEALGPASLFILRSDINCSIKGKPHSLLLSQDRPQKLRPHRGPTRIVCPARPTRSMVFL